MLRDVVGGADFSTNAVVALIVFFLVFVGLGVWVLTRKKRTVDRWAGLPLDDDEAQPREPRGTDRGTKNSPSDRAQAHGSSQA